MKSGVSYTLLRVPGTHAWSVNEGQDPQNMYKRLSLMASFEERSFWEKNIADSGRHQLKNIHYVIVPDELEDGSNVFNSGRLSESLHSEG